MHMQKTLEQLNEVVLTQGRELEKLKVELKHMRAKLEALGEVAMETPNEPPPHY